MNVINSHRQGHNQLILLPEKKLFEIRLIQEISKQTAWCVMQLQCISMMPQLFV